MPSRLFLNYHHRRHFQRHRRHHHYRHYHRHRHRHRLHHHHYHHHRVPVKAEVMVIAQKKSGALVAVRDSVVEGATTLATQGNNKARGAIVRGVDVENDTICYVSQCSKPDVGFLVRKSTLWYFQDVPVKMRSILIFKVVLQTPEILAAFDWIGKYLKYTRWEIQI